MSNLKKFLTLILLSFFAWNADAQFHVGIKAGVNAGKIDGKSFKQEFNYSYLVGGFAEIGISEKLSINPEVLFSQTTATRDTSFKNTLPDFNSDQMKAKLTYLSIPILLDLRLVGPLHIQAGPQFGIKLNKNTSLLENGEEAFKTGDFSLAGGATVNISSFRVGARYVIGLSELNDAVDEDSWKSQALQLTVGLAF
ncbi:hypothetical protein GCM10027051_23420 [Niabella terrae]